MILADETDKDTESICQVVLKIIEIMQIFSEVDMPECQPSLLLVIDELIQQNAIHRIFNLIAESINYLQNSKKVESENEIMKKSMLMSLIDMSIKVLKNLAIDSKNVSKDLFKIDLFRVVI